MPSDDPQWALLARVGLSYDKQYLQGTPRGKADNGDAFPGIRVQPHASEAPEGS